MTKLPTLGKRIRELRVARELSQRDLAERVAARLRKEDGRGFDFSYLSKIENDHLVPSTTALLQSAAELGTDSDELLALAAKAPPDVGETLKKSPGARAFFRSATNKNLSEDEWQDLLHRLGKK